MTQVATLIIFLLYASFMGGAYQTGKDEVAEAEFSIGVEIALSLPENFVYPYRYPNSNRLKQFVSISNKENCACGNCKRMSFCKIIKKNRYYPYCEGKLPKSCWVCVQRFGLADFKKLKGPLEMLGSVKQIKSYANKSGCNPKQ